MSTTTKIPSSAYWFIAILGAFIIGCSGGIPKRALELSQESLKDRQLQTRRFDIKDKKKLLLAAVALAQDMGYTIDESTTSLGVVVGSKDRDATNGGQIAGAIFVAALTGVSTPVDTVQKIRLSMVTRPIGENSTTLRVTFQRVVWNSQGQISKLERINDPKIYAEFFQKLSKSVFLEAQEI